MNTATRLAQLVGTIRRIESGAVAPLMGAAAFDMHTERLEAIMRDAPSGSGFDNGTTLDDASQAQRLVFNTAFHHMDENGYYDGWSEHQVIVTPCLQFGFAIRVTGRDRNDIKAYIGDVFHAWLSAEVQS